MDLKRNENQKTFQEELKNELDNFLASQKAKFPEHDLLKIDLHCHDYNSDEPDELLGRILNVPETWLSTEKLIETLQKNHTDVITITNHNNARSCFELIKKGVDVLVGSEFTCMVPDFNISIHVLAYGFNAEQERILNKLRRNVYNFQRFALSNNIPTIWAHPLYYYSPNGLPPIDFFNKMGLIFERFEVLNGQRDTWQNILVKSWFETLTPDKIDEYCDLYNINPKIYCKNPYKKSFTSGSDSHMGIFAGQTGTYLYVPNLKQKLKKFKPSELALEAIKKGYTAPYGNHQNSEKLTIAFLDYFCQIALYKRDPGLMRILLHKGTVNDKLLAFFLNNSFAELRQHKVTMRFIELFHNCFMGKSPSFSKRLIVPNIYKPIFDDAKQIAEEVNTPSEDIVKFINSHINTICNKLNIILYGRLNEKTSKFKKNNKYQHIGANELNDFIEKLEIPGELRSLFNNKGKSNNKVAYPDIYNFLDGLSFPFLASSIILGAYFTSARVMYKNRTLLKTISTKLNKYHHPERLLWLTDTFNDKNGVSVFLQEMHKEIKKRNLPIDILVCSKTVKPDDHLIVLEPLTEFNLPFSEDFSIRIPNFLEIHNLFLKNEYDRIICSTEGIMGLVALYLKNAYSVDTYFYMHTDWILFARKVIGLNIHNLNRVRRILRAYYKSFDGLIVLNSDHLEWLTGHEMGFDKTKVFLSAHWVDKIFKPSESLKSEIFKTDANDIVLLFSGRLSHEKGVMDIPFIFKQLKTTFPKLKIVFAGTGPAEEELKKLIPEAVFLGWVNHQDMPNIYNSADLLILPSKFDTFSCAVLEAMSCGLPVVAYKVKGPKEIVDHTKNGYLAANKNEMIYWITEFLNSENIRKTFSKRAIEKAKNYNPDIIIEKLFNDIQLKQEFKYEEMHL